MESFKWSSLMKQTIKLGTLRILIYLKQIKFYDIFFCYKAL